MSSFALGIVAVVGGLGLLLIALALRRANGPAPSALPAAKIEDGQPFEVAQRPRRVRWGYFLSGAALLGFAGYLAAVFHSLYQSDFMKLGRPLRVRGRCRLPRTARGAGGHDGTQPRLAGIGLWQRARLGARWHAAARAEQASIPAFEELAEHLRGGDADDVLVARCRDAARDESRHADRCYALARAYSGIPWSPGEMPRGSIEHKDLDTIARESFVDGCVGEAIGAAIARRGAELAIDTVIGETLASIAADEQRHAELAWAIVAFCIERGGDAVARALASTSAFAAKASRGPTNIPRAEVDAIAAEVAVEAHRRLAVLTDRSGRTGSAHAS